MDKLKKIALFFVLMPMLFSTEQSIYSNKHFMIPSKQFEIGVINVNKLYKENGESNIVISSLRYGLSPNLEIIYPGVKYRFLHTNHDESALLLKLNDYGSDVLEGTFYLIETGLLNRYYHGNNIIIDAGVLYEHEFSEVYKDDYSYKLFIQPGWKYGGKLQISIRAGFSKNYAFERDYVNNIYHSFQENSQIGPVVNYYLSENTDINIGCMSQNKMRRIKINGDENEYSYYNNKLILEAKWRF